MLIFNSIECYLQFWAQKLKAYLCFTLSNFFLAFDIFVGSRWKHSNNNHYQVSSLKLETEESYGNLLQVVNCVFGNCVKLNFLSCEIFAFVCLSFQRWAFESKQLLTYWYSYEYEFSGRPYRRQAQNSNQKKICECDRRWTAWAVTVLDTFNLCIKLNI